MTASGNPPAAVVLLSGGIDSSTLIHYVRKTLGAEAVHALSLNYGQRHVRELEAARVQAEAVGAQVHREIALDFLGPLLKDGSALIAGGAEVPDLDDLPEAERNQPPTYVPNRNMILLSIAAAYAEANGMRDVYYGAQAQDEYGYWDCTTGYLERLNATLALNRKEAVTIHAPFITKSKAETLKTGLELGVDFGATWSCYRGGERPCESCPTCVERRNAFDEAGVADPLLG